MNAKAIFNGTFVQLSAYLYPSELKLGDWYRSKDTVPGGTFGGHMLNKKWFLQEEFNLFMMWHQQAGLAQNIIKFEPKGYEEEVFALSMEYFHFPLTLLGGGLAVSVIIFCFEILIGRNKRK